MDNSTISIVGSDEERILGSNFSLTCTVDGSNRLLMPEWCRVRDDQHCEATKGNATFSEATCTWFMTLLISNFSRELEGVYRCFVPNTSLVHEATLNILNEQEGVCVCVHLSCNDTFTIPAVIG